jgi:hypothetical protein
MAAGEGTDSVEMALAGNVELLIAIHCMAKVGVAVTTTVA